MDPVFQVTVDFGACFPYSYQMARQGTTGKSRSSYDQFGLAFLLTALLLFLASFFPEVRLWGFNSCSYFGWYGRFALLAASALTWFLANRSSLNAEPQGKAKPVSWPVASLGLVAIFGLIFYLLRARTHFLGDGLQLLARLAENGPPIRLWNPGAYWVQDSLFGLVGQAGTEGARLTFQLISVGSGILAVALLCFAASRLFDAWWDRFLFVVGIATGGYALLFFGYIENYPVFVLLVLSFGLLGLLNTLGHVSRWLVLVPLLLAGLFHPYTVAMIPAAFYLLFQGTSVGRWIGNRGRTVWIGAAALVVVGGGVVFYHFYTTSYFFRLSLVPILADRLTVEGYTLFSAKHLLDYANLLFQLQPAILVLVATFFVVPLTQLLKKPEYRFLLIFQLPCLAIPFIFDPKLGMARDWDVFAFAGVPLTLLVYTALFDSGRSQNRHRSAILFAVAVSVMVLAPRALVQAAHDKGIELMDNLIALDPVKNRKGESVLLKYLVDNGQRAEAEARLARQPGEFPERRRFDEGLRFGDQGRFREAIRKMKEAIRINPSYYVAWCFMGRGYAELGQFDSAMAMLKIAEGLNPRNPTTYNNYGIVSWLQNDLEQAEQWWLKSREVYADDRDALEWLVKLYHRQGKRSKYLAVLQELMKKPDASLESMSMMAQEYIFQNKYDRAAAILRSALSKGMDPAFVQDLQERYPELRVLLGSNH